jgi:integrase
MRCWWCTGTVCTVGNSVDRIRPPNRRARPVQRHGNELAELKPDELGRLGPPRDAIIGEEALDPDRGIVARVELAREHYPILVPVPAVAVPFVLGAQPVRAAMVEDVTDVRVGVAAPVPPVQAGRALRVELDRGDESPLDKERNQILAACLAQVDPSPGGVVKGDASGRPHEAIGTPTDALERGLSGTEGPREIRRGCRGRAQLTSSPASTLADALHALRTAPVPIFTVDPWAERFLASRIDIDSNTTKNYRSALRKAGETFGTRDPQTTTVDEVATWISELAGKHKPGTVQLYPLTFRLLLDYAQVDPNPARDPRVKLPKQVREEPNPPSAEHTEAILGRWVRSGGCSSSRSSRARSGSGRRSVCAGLTSMPGAASPLPRSATKRDRARWVYLPAWLMEAIEETCPLEDRVPERKVFGGITEASAYQAMTRACKNAKVPHYHPHDLRHRRITIWHESGVLARELAERAGHARPSTSLDVYSHVMPPDEIASERFLSLLTDGGDIRRPSAHQNP